MTSRARAKAIPDYLIYEMDDGKPIYYHGYQDVLSGKKDEDWIISDWNKTIEIIENITFNIKELLEKAKN